MSELVRLKGQISAVGQQAKSTADGLAGFKSKFSQAVGQVNATIGGSAQQVDKNMIAALQAAEKQVSSAVAALQQAAATATKYASSL